MNEDRRVVQVETFAGEVGDEERTDAKRGREPTRSARRALELWRELERETGTQLFNEVGVAWFETGDDDFTRRSEATLRRLGVPCTRLTPEESRRLYPSRGVDGVRSTLLEPGAGVIFARQATHLFNRMPPVLHRAPGLAAPARACLFDGAARWSRRSLPRPFSICNARFQRSSQLRAER